MVFDNTAFLIQINDGRVYSMESVGTPANNQSYGGQDVFTDSTGNIYFMSSGRVFKVDVANPSNMTATLYSPSVDTVQNFAVDNQGNLFYNRGGTGARLRFATTGGIHAFQDTALGDYTVYWYGFTGYDGVLYIVSRVHSWTPRVDRVTVTENNEVLTDRLTGGTYDNRSQLEWYRLVDRMIVRSGNTFYSVYFDPGDFDTVESHQLDLGSNVEQVTSFRSSLFLLTQDHRIHSVDLMTMNTNEVFSNTGNSYEFYSINAVSEDEVQFHAFHLPTASVVYGLIDTVSGDMSISDQESAYGNVIYELIEM